MLDMCFIFQQMALVVFFTPIVNGLFNKVMLF